MTLTTGSILNNRYRIVKLLGQGGFGAVYRAWDINLEMACALKENNETSPQSQRQFLREAQILHTLRHPNLPLVKDHFVIPEQGQYLVMDYIEGPDLEELRAQSGGIIPQAQALVWGMQILEALLYMHRQNPPVIHRDIKPANIKITQDNRAVLVDFGIAKVFDPKSRTTAGARAITAGYSPFEQYGSAPTDARTDIYALGATLYALLTGQEPTESIARVAGAELTPPRLLNPAISEVLERVLLKALGVMPDQRFQSADEFKAALTGMVKGISTTPPAPLPTIYGTMPMADAHTGVRPPSQPPLRVQPISPAAASPGYGYPATMTAPTYAPSPRKTLPWAWIAGGCVVLLLLVIVPLGIFGINQLLPDRKTEAPTQPIAEVLAPTNTPRPPASDTPAWTPSPTATLPPTSTPTSTPSPTAPAVLGGYWLGTLTEVGGEQRVFTATFTFYQTPGSNAITGSMVFSSPDGYTEPHDIVAGTFDGVNFQFYESEGRYFWGTIESGHLTGYASWNCYNCEYWGTIEAYEQSSSPTLLDGYWLGTLTEVTGDQRVFTADFYFSQSPGSNILTGSMVFSLPDGYSEPHDIAGGTFDGVNFRFYESEGRYFWGTVEAGHLTGFAGWNCYDCEYWGVIEASDQQGLLLSLQQGLDFISVLSYP